MLSHSHSHLPPCKCKNSHIIFPTLHIIVTSQLLAVASAIRKNPQLIWSQCKGGNRSSGQFLTCLLKQSPSNNNYSLPKSQRPIALAKGWLRFPLTASTQPIVKERASEEGNNTKSIEVGRITVLFYQPDVWAAHKLEHRDRSQHLSDHEVSGGMDQRRRERDTLQQMNHVTLDQLSLVCLWREALTESCCCNMLINHGSGLNHTHLAIMFSLSRFLNGILTVHVFIFKLT